jgi:type IV pilus assembly protein PilB
LGEILTEGGLITEMQLTSALHSQGTWGGKLGSTLVRMGFVKEEDILCCLAAQLRLPAVDFKRVKVSPRAIQEIPLRIVEKYDVVPVALKEEAGKKTIILAMSDPTNLDAIAEIQFQTGLNVRPVVATESAIARAADEYYRRRRGKSRYGHEKRVDLAQVAASDQMVILERGEEKTVSPLEGADAAHLLKILIRALERKGVITQKDLEDALSSPAKT